jgi:hypothetical protein
LENKVLSNFSAQFPLTERNKGSQKTCKRIYRFDFNGKEKDDEINGVVMPMILGQGFMIVG